MKKKNFTGILQELIDRAESGDCEDVDFIINKLNGSSTFAMTRYVDFALGSVENQFGIDRIEYYLFNGSIIQRNYCSLYFNRKGDWVLVKKAFNQGLIDEIQAYAR